MKGSHGARPSGEPTKAKRLGITQRKYQAAQKIAQHPEIVERIKKKAKLNDDIPTKTAVLSEIRYENEKVRRKAAEGKREKSRAVYTTDQLKYVLLLQKIIRWLPRKPPKNWTEDGLSEARAYVAIIFKRLEAFK